jgi:hypothetical protein
VPLLVEKGEAEFDYLELEAAILYRLIVLIWKQCCTGSPITILVRLFLPYLVGSEFSYLWLEVIELLCILWA